MPSKKNEIPPRDFSMLTLRELTMMRDRPYEREGYVRGHADEKIAQDLIARGLMEAHPEILASHKRYLVRCTDAGAALAHPITVASAKRYVEGIQSVRDIDLEMARDMTAKLLYRIVLELAAADGERVQLTTLQRIAIDTLKANLGAVLP